MSPPGIVSSRVKMAAVATIAEPSSTARLRSGSNTVRHRASSSSVTSSWKALSVVRRNAGNSSAVAGRISMPPV